MPIKVKLEDGTEVETFTAEETQAQKDAALEEYKKANPDKSGEITKLTDDLKKVNEELVGLKDKDTNFKTLREAKQALETKVDELNKTIDDKVNNAKKEVLEGVMKEHYDDVMSRLSGDDKDLKAKIELQYKRLADPAATKAEVEKKLTDAYVLATGEQRPGIGQTPFASGGVGRIKVEDKSKTPITAEEAELAKRMAAAGGIKLEDKDLK